MKHSFHTTPCMQGEEAAPMPPTHVDCFFCLVTLPPQGWLFFQIFNNIISFIFGCIFYLGSISFVFGSGFIVLSELFIMAHNINTLSTHFPDAKDVEICCLLTCLVLNKLFLFWPYYFPEISAAMRDTPDTRTQLSRVAGMWGEGPKTLIVIFISTPLPLPTDYLFHRSRCTMKMSPSHINYVVIFFHIATGHFSKLLYFFIWDSILPPHTSSNSTLWLCDSVAHNCFIFRLHHCPQGDHFIKCFCYPPLQPDPILHL